tara:strand:+ start:1697 stop:1849 length:153 start_codon:yes stop_codon:yes gene_type:complete
MPKVINPKTGKAKHLSYSPSGMKEARRAAAKGMVVEYGKKKKKKAASSTA